MRFEIDWASRIVRSKFTVFALFCFVFEGNFPSTSPGGAYSWRGDLTEGFCVTGLGGLYLEGLIFGILWNVFIGYCRVVESNHVNMDTEGAIECVHLNWESILSRLNVEKI